MKTVAIAFLTTGFLWLSGIQILHAMGSDFRSVMKVQQRSMTWEQRCYSSDETYARVFATATTAHDQALNVIWPGMLMLIGGVIALRRQPTVRAQDLPASGPPLPTE